MSAVSHTRLELPFIAVPQSHGLIAVKLHQSRSPSQNKSSLLITEYRKTPNVTRITVASRNVADFQSVEQITVGRCLLIGSGPPSNEGDHLIHTSHEPHAVMRDGCVGVACGGAVVSCCSPGEPGIIS